MSRNNIANIVMHISSTDNRDKCTTTCQNFRLIEPVSWRNCRKIHIELQGPLTIKTQCSVSSRGYMLWQNKTPRRELFRGVNGSPHWILKHFKNLGPLLHLGWLCSWEFVQVFFLDSVLLLSQFLVKGCWYKNLRTWL